MKKLYTTLVALLTATTMFAQVQEQALPKKEITSSLQKVEDFQRPVRKMDASKASATFTYAFLYNAAEASGIAAEALSVYYLHACADGNAAASDNGSTKKVMWAGMGQIFDFYAPFYDHWATYLSGRDFHAPNIKTADSYDIDSVHLVFRYTKGSEVTGSFTDTLVISYAVGLEYNGYSYFGGDFPIGSTSNTASMVGIFPYVDPNTFGFDINELDDSVFVVTDRILLTESYMAENTAVYSFPTPPALKNIRNKKTIGVYYSFIPGTAENRDTLNTVMGVDLNMFRPTVTVNDFMTGYNKTISQGGSLQLANDLNTPLFTDWETFNDPVGAGDWYLEMTPTRFYTEYLYPDVSITLTCNDCDILNVRDIERKNITVRPNPATNQFTVDLDGSETAQVQLFNLVGQLVYETRTNDATVSVNVNNFNSGVYMLKITQNGKVYTSKVIVK